MYLTLDEFKQMNCTIKDESKFNELEKQASELINHITHFYDSDFNNENLEDDLASKLPPIVDRAKAFKRAVAYQIEFMSSANVSNAYEIASQGVNSFTVGHTSVSLAGNATKDLTVDNTGVCYPAYDLLAYYGFLYNGVDHL